MTQTDALQKALVRFGAAVDSLERFLGQLFEDRDQAVKLKEQLRDARAKYSAEEDDDVESPDQSSTKTTSRATAARQRRFRTTERIDNIYFGTPGLANIVSDVGLFLHRTVSNILTTWCSLQICKSAVIH